MRKEIKQEKKIKVSKVTALTVHEREENGVIVNIDGWRMRVYFDESLTKEQKASYAPGRLINVNYFGDIKDVHSLELLPIKG